MRTREEVAHAFTPQKVNPSQEQRILRMNIAFKDLADEVAELAPESADRTAALRKLLVAKMMVIQAISHEPKAVLEAATNGKNQNTKK